MHGRLLHRVWRQRLPICLFRLQRLLATYSRAAVTSLALPVSGERAGTVHLGAGVRQADDQARHRGQDREHVEHGLSLRPPRPRGLLHEQGRHQRPHAGKKQMFIS